MSIQRSQNAEVLISRRLREWEMPTLDTSRYLDPDQHGAEWLPLGRWKEADFQTPAKLIGGAELQTAWVQNDFPHPIAAIWIDDGTDAVIAQLYASTGKGKTPRVGRFHVEQRFKARTPDDLILRTIGGKALSRIPS
jgi:hypothetical protein